MVVVLKAVRGFPKNCWDSNINLNVIKGMVRLKKKKISCYENFCFRRSLCSPKPVIHTIPLWNIICLNIALLLLQNYQLFSNLLQNVRRTLFQHALLKPNCGNLRHNQWFHLLVSSTGGYRSPNSQHCNLFSCAKLIRAGLGYTARICTEVPQADEHIPIQQFCCPIFAQRWQQKAAGEGIWKCAKHCSCLLNDHN